MKAASSGSHQIFIDDSQAADRVGNIVFVGEDNAKIMILFGILRIIIGICDRLKGSAVETL